MSSSTIRHFFLGNKFSNALESREVGTFEIFLIRFEFEESNLEAKRLKFLIPLLLPVSSI